MRREGSRWGTNARSKSEEAPPWAVPPVRTVTDYIPEEEAGAGAVDGMSPQAT